MRIALAQHDFVVGDVLGNAEKVIALAKQARDEYKARLIVFPELCLTGYPPEDLLLRPELYQFIGQALERIRKVEGIAMMVGYPHEEAGARYNAASVYDAGQCLCTYYKQSLPNYSVFDEKRYFASGEQPCVITLDGVALGLSICEDIWSSAPSVQARDAGAELLLNINASPFSISKRQARERMLKQRVSETGLAIAYVNLVGGQDEVVFDGASMLVDSDGHIAHVAHSFSDEIVVVDYADGSFKSVTAPAKPREADAEIYQALVRGVRDYVSKNHFPGVVLGLSGGIDSALTLAIAVDALGAEKVLAVMMPSPYTADMSVEDARAQAEVMGVRFEIVGIKPAFEAFQDMLSPVLDNVQSGITAENLQARSRGVVLMAISNREGRMLLTTGNKSEMAVGYATLYGDMAGGFAPLKDVPKMMVYRLSNYRNTLGEVIPQRVIDRPPSAELAPGQKDEDSLPPYPVLDRILELYIERDMCPQRIVEEGFEPAVVERVTTLVDRNEYKRRQAAPGIKITRRAFGRDRRYPITSGFARMRNNHLQENNRHGGQHEKG